MSTKRNHYISKYLTKPWEFKPGTVKILDYLKMEFQDVPTNRLFAKESIFSQKQEEFFNKFVETKVPQILQEIAIGIFTTQKWKNHRALVLLMFDLMARQRAAHTGDHESVEFLTSLDEPNLNQYVSAIMSKFDLQVFTCPGDGRLFFPNSGVVYYPIVDPFHLNFGVPINGNQLLVWMEKNSDYERANYLCQSHYFYNLSVGDYSTKFILIHPDLFPLPLRDTILICRDQNEGMSEAIRRLGRNPFFPLIKK